MERAEQAADAPRVRGLPPLTPASRQRLQKVYEHGQRCLEKKDYDYANQLFTQCVVDDPGSIVYLQSFFTNLHEKYNNNKSGARLAGLKIKSSRSALSKAAAKGEWKEAFQAGCKALAINPWDIPTLLAMASAYEQLGVDECRLFLLRSALDVNSKDVEANRQAAFTLQRMGQFDQAIACWHRVEQAKPHDEEALQAISRLSVEKTIHEGGYDPELLRQGSSGESSSKISVAQYSKGGKRAEDEHKAEEAEGAEELPLEERLRQSLAKDPSDMQVVYRLADLYMQQKRFDEAEKLLERGLQASGGGDLMIRERLEEVLMRRARQQQAIAEHRYADDPTDEHHELAVRLRAHANQVELETYAAKVDRDPHNLRLKYELGIRLKRAGKIKDAIPLLQAARNEPHRKIHVLIELGECFQKIEQYKLALTSYEQAIEACQEADSDDRRLALYRAGVLATGMRELDRAERHLTELAGLDFGYRDVADRLDKINKLRHSG